MSQKDSFSFMDLELDLTCDASLYFYLHARVSFCICVLEGLTRTDS
jgi:hypothetical protein